MRGAHKSYGLAACIQTRLYGSQHLLETPNMFVVVGAVGAYLMILAIDTLQIAMSKKHIADAVLATNDGLFTAMNHHIGYVVLIIRLAISTLTNEAVGVAISGTQGAIPQRGKRNIHQRELQAFYKFGRKHKANTEVKLWTEGVVVHQIYF